MYTKYSLIQGWIPKENLKEFSINETLPRKKNEKYQFQDDGLKMDFIDAFQEAKKASKMSLDKRRLILCHQQSRKPTKGVKKIRW